MRHGEEPEARPAIPPIPWRQTVSLCSPSSGTEVMYDSPEEYEEEESRAQSISPATMSSWSDPYDPIGKTPEELDEKIARYRRDMKSSQIEANWRRAMEGMQHLLSIQNVM
jgi:hypothetical protein